MPANFKIGDAVRQVMPAPVAGEVVDMGTHGGELGFKVRTAAGDERWFKESELEASKPE